MTPSVSIACTAFSDAPVPIGTTVVPIRSNASRIGSPPTNRVSPEPCTTTSSRVAPMVRNARATISVHAWTSRRVTPTQLGVPVVPVDAWTPDHLGHVDPGVPAERGGRGLAARAASASR